MSEKNENTNGNSVGEELLKCLHEQFAINHNNEKNLFVKFLIALFALFGVYGTVWASFQCDNCVLNGCTFSCKANQSILYGCAIVVVIVLSFLVTIFINLGWGYRKDQTVNDAIRKVYLRKSHLIGCPERHRCCCQSSDCVYSFVFLENDYGKSIKDIPGLYKIFAITLSLLKFLVFLSLCYRDHIFQPESSLFLAFTAMLTAVELCYNQSKSRKINGSGRESDSKCCCRLMLLFIIIVQFLMPAMMFFYFS